MANQLIGRRWEPCEAMGLGDDGRRSLGLPHGSFDGLAPDPFQDVTYMEGKRQLHGMLIASTELKN